MDTVRRVVNQIIRYGQGSRPTLGINVLDDAPRQQYARNVRRQLEGALIVEVVPGSPAAAVGLRPCTRGPFGETILGDLVVSVGGTRVTQNEDLLCAVEEATPGEPLEVEVMRGSDPNRVEKLVVKPETRKMVRAAGQQRSGMRGGSGTLRAPATQRATGGWRQR